MLFRSVMDEPTEGLAPVIVEQVAQALRDLAAEGDIAVLLIEQNLGVATSVADRIGIMVNGRLAQEMLAGELAADRELQERLLGVRSHDSDEVDGSGASEKMGFADVAEPAPQESRVLTVVRAHGNSLPTLADLSPRTVRGFNRWNAGSPTVPVIDRSLDMPTDAVSSVDTAVPSPGAVATTASVFDFPVAATSGSAAYVAGTFDTKARELFYLRQSLERLGLRVVTVDLSTSGRTSTASVHPREVARHHPAGEAGVFSGDRGSAVAAMALAFERFILTRQIGRAHV